MHNWPLYPDHFEANTPLRKRIPVSERMVAMEHMEHVALEAVLRRSDVTEARTAAELGNVLEMVKSTGRSVWVGAVPRDVLGSINRFHDTLYTFPYH